MKKNFITHKKILSHTKNFITHKKILSYTKKFYPIQKKFYRAEVYARVHFIKKNFNKKKFIINKKKFYKKKIFIHKKKFSSTKNKKRFCLKHKKEKL